MFDDIRGFSEPWLRNRWKAILLQHTRDSAHLWPSHGGANTAATDVLLWSRTWGVATLFCWAGVGQFFLGVIKHGWEIPHSLAEKWWFSGILMVNPWTEWRFIARNIIELNGMFQHAMFDFQRVCNLSPPAKTILWSIMMRMSLDHIGQALQRFSQLVPHYFRGIVQEPPIFGYIWWFCWYFLWISSKIWL